MQPIQQDTQQEIDRVLSRLQQKGIGTSTKPVLWVNQSEMMRARNNGYPKHMHHATLASRQAVNEDQESMLISQGYGPTYIAQAYPKYLYRRNMSDKFGPKFSPTGQEDVTFNPYVEERLVKDSREESKIMTQKSPSGCSQWVSVIGLLDPLPDAAEEDAANSIARLEGQIEELRRAAALREGEPNKAAKASKQQDPELAAK